MLTLFYLITSRDSDASNSSDEESGTDDEEESSDRNQNVPAWARNPALREALEKQYGLGAGGVPMDPDLIFHEVA